MGKNKELRLRLSISLVFAAIVLIPLLLIYSDLTAIARRLWLQQLDASQQALKEEMATFRESLIPRQFVENLIKAGEVKLGLVPATMQQPVFARNRDAGIFTAATAGLLRDFYQEHGDIKPLVIVTFTTDYIKVWSWFNHDYPELKNLAAEHKERFEQTLPIFVTDNDTFSPVIANNPSAYANFQAIAKKLANDGKYDRPINQFFRDYVGDLGYRPPSHGNVYEMATKRLGSRRLFLYHMPVKNGELVYGGYFVMFASKDVTAEKILRHARESKQPQIKRFFIDALASEPKQLERDRLSLRLPFPSELAGHNSLADSPVRLPAEIGVELSLTDLRKSHEDFLSHLAAACRLIFLVVFTVAVYFFLFGFPDAFRLRLRMFAIIALSIFLPWAIIGYFCLSLFSSVQNLVGHELRAEATSSLYRLISYYYDQKLQLNLEILKAKMRMLEHVDKSPDEIKQIHAHSIVMPDNMFDLFFFRDDGVSRVFKSRTPSEIAARLPDCYLAAGYLDSLGVLYRKRSVNRKYIEQSEYVGGILDSFHLSYSGYRIMRQEGIETREWKSTDELSRMVYLLLPDIHAVGYPLRAIGKVSTSNSNFVIIKPYLFDPAIYSQRLPWQQHDLLIGQRRVDDTLLRWWPSYISSSSELKRQGGWAASTRSGGSRLLESEGKFEFVNRQYINGESLVFAGVSTASQDLRIEMLLKLFPFAMLVLAMLCLFLFTDMLSAMFITPVAGFCRATAEITDGNYQVAIRMPDSDEFSLLADSFNRMAGGLVQREKMRRFVSENLYAAIGLGESGASRTSVVTLLASDIRGFTALSEKYEPQQVVSLLNDYFTEMETAIKESGGFIERFIGDAVVAVFYQDQTVRAENRALSAAARMRARLHELNRRRAVAGLFVIDNGIGIASGEAVSGIAGSSDGRQVFSVIGEVTHLAEKLESASRHVASRILICPQTFAGLENESGLTDATELCGFSAFTPPAAVGDADA